MKILKIYVFILVVFLSSCIRISGNILSNDSIHIVKEKTLKTYPSKEAVKLALEKKKSSFLSGAAVSFDMLGAILAVTAPYGNYEGAIRLNLFNRFFPIGELGLGVSHYKNIDSNISYSTSAPYLRIGCDYNFLKDKFSGNRIYGGMRLAFSTFNFDVSGPDLQDPVYHSTIVKFDFKSQNSHLFWGELVGGLEAKIWKFIHLGWNIRYRFKLHERRPKVDNSWYIPGYGRSESTMLGGSFNLIIDI